MKKQNHGGVLVVCGDAGGAAAVEPVIRVLKNECHAVVHPVAYLQAETIWKRNGLDVETLPSKVSPEAAREVLTRVQPSALLTGTSVNDFEWEKSFIRAAGEMRLPSLAVLDFWSNYRARFTDPKDQLSCLPDRIAVMDERAKSEMIADGFPGDRLVVTGQPAFDELQTFRTGFRAEQRRQIRDELQVVGNERLVVFLSQPLSSFYGGEHRAKETLGFTEQEVFRLALDALRRIARRQKARVVIVFRAHPREQCDWLPSVNEPELRLIAPPVANVRELLMASDLVVGMNTALLMESCYLGCFTVSIQPGLKQPDALPANRQNVSRPVYREADVEPALEQALFDDVYRVEWRNRLSHFLPPGGAARNVAEHLCKLAGLQLSA